MRSFRAMVLSILGLALGGALSAESITVIMPRHEMDLIGIWERQTKEFENKTGIKVEFIQMSWDEVATKVTTDLTTGVKSSYDVIEFDNGWVSKFAAANWLEPLDKFADKAYLDSLLPGLVKTFSYGGKTLGIPWNNDTRFFFYNKALLDKAKIAGPPKTWAEVLQQSKALQAAGVKFPIAEYWNQEWALANSLAFYLYSYGNAYFDDQGRITINKPGSVEVLQFMYDLLKKYKVANPSSTTLSQEAAADLFYSGSSAYFFQGPASTYSYANDPKKSKVVGQIAVASDLPANKLGQQATLTLPEAFAIPRTSANKAAAWKYIQFMISPEKDKERSLQIGSLPLFKSLYADAQLLKLYPYWAQFVKQSAVARPLPLVDWYDELVNTTVADLQEMFVGIKTPQAAADHIAAFLEGKMVNGKKLTK